MVSRWRAGRLLVASVAAAAASAAATLGAGSALAAQGDWNQFSRCPVDNPTMLGAPSGSTSECAYLSTDEVDFNLGSDKTSDFLYAQVGVAGASGGPGTAVLGSFDGAGYSVVGPLLPFVDFCNLYGQYSIAYEMCERFEDPLLSPLNEAEFGVDGVAQFYVTPELAGTPSNFDPTGLSTPGAPVLTLPLKFHLTGLLVGADCYIGTDNHPIVLHLKGAAAPRSTSTANDPNGYPVSLTLYGGGAASDTTFAEPGATGCGPDGLLDPAMNAYLGLPRGAGKNSYTLAQLASGVASTQAGGQVLSHAYHAALGG